MSDDAAGALAGKVAFVAGGYGGIGEACAQALAREGATVVVAGRDAGKAQAVAASLEGEGGASAVTFDARDVPSIHAAANDAAARHGTIDFLVNCVGTNQIEPLLEVTEEAYDRVLDVNLRASMFLAQAVARVQVAAGRGGRHVHLLSVRAQLGMRDRGYSAYCATKGALVMLIKQHAVELSSHRITVNGVAPTVVRGEMGAHWLANPVTREHILSRIPLGRVAEPEDVVGATLFFCSPAASFVTGQTLYIDGGLTATQ